MSKSGDRKPGWRARWRERWRQGGGWLAYRAWRRLLAHGGLERHLDFRVHHIIAVAPWRLRLPERLPRQLQVRELQPEDQAALTQVRQAVGRSYERRFVEGHRGLGAWLGERLVAFVWLRNGPVLLPAAFDAIWEVGAGMIWIYDLYSDPAVVGAIPHLYARLRQSGPGKGGQWLVGQTDFDNLRSRRAHQRLGYERAATLVSLRVGRLRMHLTHARRDGRWRRHRRRGLIPLPLLLTGEHRAEEPAPAGDERLRLLCACGQEVVAAGESFTCVCGRRLGGQAGGMAQVGPPMPYWGELPQAEMRAVLGRAERDGWRTAAATLPASLREYVAADGRAAFDDVLPLPREARVLDVGAGWGGIAAPLARRYRVVALEGVEERARFIALRRQQDQLDQLTVIHGDVHQVALAPRQFDLIVVNGVLEWVALLDLSAPPAAVQMTFLHRLRELLRPGGMIYLGIENRFGWSELRGSLDHSGLPYTSLLPRPLARWVCARSPRYRAQFNVGYRTYTYSHRGYAALFAQVGLKIRCTWISPAGYNRPARLIPLDGAAIRFAEALAPVPAPSWRGQLRGWMRRRLARQWVWRWIGADFVFLIEAAPARAAALSAQAGPGACTN